MHRNEAQQLLECICARPRTLTCTDPRMLNARAPPWGARSTSYVLAHVQAHVNFAPRLRHT
eukprot:3432893-Pleurochrysis_carterae.AAC.3